MPAIKGTSIHPSCIHLSIFLEYHLVCVRAPCVGSCPGRGTLDLHYTLHGMLKGSWEFVQPVYMCFVDLKAFHSSIMWEMFESMGSEALCYGPCGLYTTGPGAWLTVPAVSQTCSQYMLDSGRAALCHQFCSLFLWTEYLGSARGRRGSGSGATGFHLCFSQMILSYWILWTRTFSMHSDGLQLSVKQL